MITGPVLRGGDGVRVLGAAGAGRHSQVQLDPREGCTKKKKKKPNKPALQIDTIDTKGGQVNELAPFLEAVFSKT